MKRVLFLCPEFNGYGVNIKNDIENEDITFELINLDCDSFFWRTVSKISTGVSCYFNEKRILKDLKKIKRKDFDALLVVKGAGLTDKIISFLLSDFSFDKKVIYHWDSIKNFSFALHLNKYFDIAATFDPNDSEEYSMNYVPLFYIESLVPQPKIAKVYDFYFLGTFHSDRHLILKKVKEICDYRGYKVKFEVYIGFLEFIKRKCFDVEFSDFSHKDFIFRKVSLEDCYKRVSSSSVVLDIPHTDQVGLTMRTFEALGLNKMLVTTNKTIALEEIYTSNKVFILDGDFDRNILDEVINIETTMSNDEFSYYSCRAWFSKLIC